MNSQTHCAFFPLKIHHKHKIIIYVLIDITTLSMSKKRFDTNAAGLRLSLRSGQL